LTALLFFLSGAAALVYQTAWQRILALGSGASIYSVAMIVGAFMAGLGIGSLRGGERSASLSPRAAMRAFGFVEGAIGLFGALSPFLYYDLLYSRAAWLYAAPLRAGIAHFVALLPPTVLMGMSLPFLVRATVREAARASRTVGILYGVNVLGAACGALVTPWVLIRFAGIDGAVYAAVALNLLVGILALRLSRGMSDAEPSAAPPPPAGEAAGSRPFGLWLALYATSGFVALALEILWFRIVDVGVKSSAFTFGTVLALYLLGCGAGSLVGARFAPRLARPLRAFLVCQCLLLLASAASVLVLVHLPVANWFVSYWARYEGVTLGHDGAPGEVLRLYLLFPALLYALPTILMGLVFPILQRAVHDDVKTSGRKVGVLQAANIAGCVAGSLLVGLAALGTLGTAGTLRALMVVGIGFALVGARAYRRDAAFPVLAIALAAAALALPGQDRLWARLHGTDTADALLAEDASGVAAITPEPPSGLRVSVNGKGNSTLPFGSTHTYLGALPALMHPAPEDVAIVGLGSGDTAWAAACRPETRRVTVFELNRPQPGLLGRLAARESLPDLARFLHDPRVHFVLDDGRSSLEHGAARYDLIEADALRPHSAGSGNLYSVEFFAACARRLKPGGVVCTWAPTPRVQASFAAALPHVVHVDAGAGEIVLVGSREAFAIDRGAWRERAESPAVRAWLGDGISRTLVSLLRGARHAEAAPAGASVNHDLFPRDEFLSP
jgi:predicted membrane-bound spermidine synthase